MGIHQLMKLLGDNAASSIKENEIKNYFGRKIAVDASMALYQFCKNFFFLFRFFFFFFCLTFDLTFFFFCCCFKKKSNCNSS